MSENTTPAPAATPAEPAPATPPPPSPPSTEWPVMEEGSPSDAAASSPEASPASPTAAQPGLSAPRGLKSAVDLVFCIDVTGSMTPIIDQVRANALRFYDDVQSNLTGKGKNVDQLRVRVLAFRDFKADGAAALQESPFFTLPADRAEFSDFVNGLIAEGGGDAPESGLEAVALAVNSPWTTRGDRRGAGRGGGGGAA